MENRHGGDVYRNRVKYDFSVNINPLGVPKPVKNALRAAAEDVTRYPDAQAAALTETVAKLEGVEKEWILFGNGASELFLAIIHAFSPGVITIPVPSFFGYEHAARAGNGEIRYISSLKELKRDTELLFLANPNNPNGAVMEREELEELLTFCRENQILVVLDECFMDFCEENRSMKGALARFPNLIIVRAFTKIFAIPGARLGYLLCADGGRMERLRRQLPEWNLSCFAQRAGVACGECGEFLAQTPGKVGEERRFLREKLAALGLETADEWGESRANFLLIRSPRELYAPLLARGILIRDCQNFRGLGRGYYRLAVRPREENRVLLAALEEILSH